MTSIECKKSGRRFSVIARDHAVGSAKVCAGISAIMYTLAGYIHNKDDGSIDVKSMILTDGYSELVFSGGVCALCGYEMALIGLMQICASYPDYCKISYTE